MWTSKWILGVFTNGVVFILCLIRAYFSTDHLFQLVLAGIALLTAILCFILAKVKPLD
jgi:hypothetical protein